MEGESINAKGSKATGKSQCTVALGTGSGRNVMKSLSVKV